MIIPFSIIKSLNDFQKQENSWTDDISDDIRRQIEGFCPWGLREWGFSKHIPILPIAEL